MNRIIAALIAASAVAFATAPAQAKYHHYKHHRHYERVVHHTVRHKRVESGEHAFYQQPAVADTAEADQRYALASNGVARASYSQQSTVYSYDEGHIVGGRPAGCPHAFCGCGTSLHIFGRIIPELNLAANWRRFPPASPAPGMVAWRYGHVFAIESVNSDGTVVAYDPNSGGHRTRVHTVSLRGFHVVNPHGERMAMR